MFWIIVTIIFCFVPLRWIRNVVVFPFHAYFAAKRKVEIASRPRLQYIKDI